MTAETTVLIGSERVTWHILEFRIGYLESHDRFWVSDWLSWVTWQILSFGLPHLESHDRCCLSDWLISSHMTDLAFLMAHFQSHDISSVSDWLFWRLATWSFMEIVTCSSKRKKSSDEVFYNIQRKFYIRKMCFYCCIKSVWCHRKMTFGHIYTSSWTLLHSVRKEHCWKYW